MHAKYEDILPSVGPFTDDLLKEANSINSERNFIISPLSLVTSLAILVNGARGTSKDELTYALHLSRKMTAQKLDSFYLHFLSDIKVKLVSQQMRIENLALISAKCEVSKEFEENVKNSYYVHLEKVNFLTQGESCVKKVNDWVTESTQGLIQELMSLQPPLNTNFMLFNSIFFESTWLFKFDLDTYVRNFFVNDTNKEKVVFMKARKQFCYAEIVFSSASDGVRMAEVPYNGTFNMVILFPPVFTRINAVIASYPLSAFLEKFHKEKTHRLIDLHIPKFKIEAKTQLNDVLGKLGIKGVFSPKNAGLSPISEAQELRLPSLIQATSLEVNEEGTNSPKSPFERYYVPDDYAKLAQTTLILDRPFVFVIYDRLFNLPVFVGKVSDPQFPRQSTENGTE